MSAYNILIMNGPNLGALGERQPDIYGYRGMGELQGMLRGVMGEEADRVRLGYFQSNSEGALIDRLTRARDEEVHGIVFNAGAYTHTSLALADCLAWIGIPCVEVHLSNVWARQEKLRHTSTIARHCVGIVAGFGLMSYALGVMGLVERLNQIGELEE